MKNDEAKFLIVEAEVRYWEDATINGVEDADGDKVPFRDGAMWRPVIDLETGNIVNWPIGTTAEFHYKVCDQGEYWLADKDMDKKLKWGGSYVPDEFLCFGDDGYGDYIIFNVDYDGHICGFRRPFMDREDWNEI